MKNYTVTEFLHTFADDSYSLTVALYELRKVLSQQRLDLTTIERLVLGNRYFSEGMSINLQNIKGRTMSLGFLLALCAVKEKPEIANVINDDNSMLFQGLICSKPEKIQFVELLWHAPELMQCSLFRNTLAVIRSYIKGEGYNEIAAKCITENLVRPYAMNEDEYFSIVSCTDDHDYSRPVLGKSFYNFKNSALVKYSQNQTDGLIEDFTEVICNNAFLGCRKLETLTIHKNICYIGNTAISCCERLKTITFEGTDVKFGLFPILECPNLESIIVPEGAVDYYKTKLPYYKSIIRSEYPTDVEEIVDEDTISPSDISDDEFVELTMELIDNAKTDRGGYTKSQLAAVGIGWPPPPKNVWQKSLVGKKITKEQFQQFNEHVYKTKAYSINDKRVVMTCVSEDSSSSDQVHGLDFYKKKFASLHTAIVKGKKAPHKALLLLAIMDAAEDQCYECEPVILLDDELQDYFKACVKRYGIEGSSPNICMPFYHMRSESFWKQNYRSGYDETSQLSSYSISSLNTMIKDAVIDEELWELMRDSHSRKELRQVLEETYLST